MERVVIIAGGNLGDIAATLAAARKLIEERVGVIVASSSEMESEAWGFICEDKFLNQILICETELDCEQLLDVLQEIETMLGRERDPSSARYTSRTIDMDILFYGNEIIATKRLAVPHPLIAMRDFVLLPLCEVAPDLQHPVSGKSMRQLREELLKNI